ncbi:hypothetical protein GCM10009799_27150 [Nocardiopsis rhodophaea]|uniref:Uncharacterized protein n=1 Tax=Nocardiopsis rhodophaea TaxID=280238 RepID=A0ABP5EHC6_9ACTN
MARTGTRALGGEAAETAAIFVDRSDVEVVADDVLPARAPSACTAPEGARGPDYSKGDRHTSGAGAFSGVTQTSVRQPQVAL